MRFLLAVSLLALTAGCAEPQGRQENWDTLRLDDDPWLGDREAPLVIAELSAPKCGTCAYFHQALLPDIKTQWLDTGRAVLVFVQSTIGYAFDVDGGIAMECVYAHGGRGAFWDFTDRVYAQQSDFTEANVRDWLLDSARAHAYDAEALRACYDGRQTAALVDDDLALLRELGAGQTPILYVFGDGPRMRTTPSGLEDALAAA